MPDGTEPLTTADQPSRLDRLPPAAMCGSIVALAASVFLTGSNLWWFSDDWNIFAEYSSGSVLEPFNDHLSLVPILGYRLMFETIGMEHYLGVQLLGLAAYATLGWAAYRYGAPRIGPWCAVGVASLVMWNSAASTNAMFPFLLNFSLPIALMLVIWRQLDRAEVGGDAVASVALCCALATSALGVIVAGAIAVELFASCAPLRRWLTLAPGPVLWLAWYLSHPADTGDGGSVGEVLRYAARMFLGGARSLTFDIAWLGVVAAVAFGGAVVAAVVTRRRISSRSLGAMAALVAFIGLTSVARVGIDPYIPPDELRYQWTVAAFMVLVLVTLAEPHRDSHRTTVTAGPRREQLSTAVPWVLCVVLVGNAVVLLGGMDRWNDQVGVALPGVRSNIAAAELAGDRADPDRRLPISYVPLTVGGYLDAVDRLGSPLAPLDQPIGGGELERRAADELLIKSLDIRLEERGIDHACGDDSPAIGPDGFTDVLPGSTLHVIAGTAEDDRELLVSRFGEAADGYSLGTIPEGFNGTVRFPADDPSAPEGLSEQVGRYRLSLPLGHTYGVCSDA